MKTFFKKLGVIAGILWVLAIIIGLFNIQAGSGGELIGSLVGHILLSLPGVALIYSGLKKSEQQ